MLLNQNIIFLKLRLLNTTARLKQEILKYALTYQIKLENHPIFGCQPIEQHKHAQAFMTQTHH